MRRAKPAKPLVCWHSTVSALHLRLTEIKLPLEIGREPSLDDLRRAACERLQITDAELLKIEIFRRAYDARKRSAITLIYTLLVQVTDYEEILAKQLPHVSIAPDTSYQFVCLGKQANRKVVSPDAKRINREVVSALPSVETTRPVIIGFGPCGLFAALILAQMGLRPIVLERGKAVRERTKDTFGLWRGGVLNPESNVQFGEGGAGTFSDGKLWSQVSDPKHYGRKVLEEFVRAGAPEEILYVSKPHIGTFRLVGVIEKMRAEIESLGGEIRFQAKLIDIAIEDHHVRGVNFAAADTGKIEHLRCDQLILAIGHSARDTFELLHQRGVYLEAKAFSIGVRIEHPQHLIDNARFGPFAGHALLGAADYKLVHHAKNGRSVYSFCMCPGGTVVAAASEPGGVVTNGMSQYSRNERNANAGLVVGITPADFADPHPLAGIAFQRQLERRAFALGGSNYHAPGQRVGDFLNARASTDLGTLAASYTPGVTPTDLALLLPDYAVVAMREALPALDRQIRGFALPDALMTGVETRTSSPVRIKRGADFQSVNIAGLYPAGEGAAYAGGIMSAAIDGIEVAQALAQENR